MPPLTPHVMAWGNAIDADDAEPPTTPLLLNRKSPLGMPVTGVVGLMPLAPPPPPPPHPGPRGGHCAEALPLSMNAKSAGITAHARRNGFLISASSFPLFQLLL